MVNLIFVLVAEDGGQVVGACECGNESLGFMKCRELLE
jgi:hypothetical protein